MDGIIVIYKEKGYTSHDVVAKLRGILHQKKIGHTGTLDPEAEGVLPVCLGKATKLCEMVTDHAKEYRAVMRLGVATDTEDMTGTVVETLPVTCTEADIRRVLASYEGGYDQIPPMYSAIKVDGKKLYQLARAGKEIERQPRHVEIRSIDAISIEPEGETPRVEMQVACGKGTYIRSLCRDIGRDLETCAAMESLVRTRVGVFDLEDAVTLGRVAEAAAAGDSERYLVPIRRLLSDLPVFTCDPEHDLYLKNGNKLQLSWGQGETGNNTLVLDHAGNVTGIFLRDGDWLKPVKMLL